MRQNKLIVFMGMGFELVGLVIGSLILGQMIDAQLGWKGYASAGLIVFGLTGWVVHIVLLLQKMMRDGED